MGERIGSIKSIVFFLHLLKISNIPNKAKPKRPIDAPMTMNVNGVDADSIKFNNPYTTNLIRVRHETSERQHYLLGYKYFLKNLPRIENIYSYQLQRKVKINN